MAAETNPTSYYGNLPKFLVSYLKSMYGAAATAENDFGYDWHPKILGDHTHIASFAAMADRKVTGTCCAGQNPATSLNGGPTTQTVRQLEWLHVRDKWTNQTGTKSEMARATRLRFCGSSASDKRPIRRGVSKVSQGLTMTGRRHAPGGSTAVATWPGARPSRRGATPIRPGCRGRT